MNFRLTGYWKTALTCIVLLVSTIVIPNAASAQSCSTNCLRVYSIALQDGGTSIRGTVKLIDDTGSAGGARSAVVHAVWTRPDGSSFDQYDVIGTRLRAEFQLYTAGEPGLYTLTVAGVSKAGYTFDPANSAVLSDTIQVGDATNQPPVAVPNADAVSGSVPLSVGFDSTGSADPDGTIVAYDWNFGDGTSSTQANPTHTYLSIGNFPVTLTVTDNDGASASGSLTIQVSDTASGCVSNCMAVDQIAMSFRASKSRVKGKVWIVDEFGSLVEGATVHGIWTLPDGSTVEQYRKVRSKLRASFSLKAGPAGIYTLTVVDVSKAGHTFDPDGSNVLSGLIEVSP